MSPLQLIPLHLLIVQLNAVLSISSFIIEQSSSSSLLRPRPFFPSQNNLLQCQKNQSVSVASIVVVRTNDDIQSLADLRYHEWILNNNGSRYGDGDHNGRRRVPSLSSFRLATTEIYHERVAAGSTMFLAMMDNVDVNNHGNNHCHLMAVAAAELSPIELQGVYKDQNDNDVIDKVINPTYITDVVTSSSFRHCGIGSNLMRFVENYAWKEKGTRIVYLHVMEENVGARKFYERLGYRESERRMGSSSSSSLLENDGEEHIYSRIENCLVAMDYDKLAANAGTMGQTLMMKRLLGPSTDDGQSSPEKSLTSGGGGGFGRPKKERKKMR